MDTISHAVYGYIIADVVGRSTEEAVLCVVIASAPDTLSWAQRTIQKSDSWAFYNTLHSFETCAYLGVPAIVLFLGLHSILPFLALAGWATHIIIDEFTHGEGKRWWVERVWTEYVGWGLILAYILVSYKVVTF